MSFLRRLLGWFRRTFVRSLPAARDDAWHVVYEGPSLPGSPMVARGRKLTCWVPYPDAEHPARFVAPGSLCHPSFVSLRSRETYPCILEPSADGTPWSTCRRQPYRDEPVVPALCLHHGPDCFLILHRGTVVGYRRQDPGWCNDTTAVILVDFPC